eukprot:TRINITY_DN6306_c0_g1_i4.p1 TRINITY_DN6306_c0_g1~~TRINITY_DN6306_c0_g1_i4.p1  ORF type:complete len:315 (-),score=36.62 TRINITY_DN6306_c0_g1_i4:25-969(-)
MKPITFITGFIAGAILVSMITLIGPNDDRDYDQTLSNSIRSSSSTPFVQKRDWISGINSAAHRITSQGRQDGCISYIFNIIGTTDKYYIEFGFDADDYEGGIGPNTKQLYLNGWNGLLLDGGHDNPSINLHKHFITPENIVELFKMYSVPEEFDYLSVDIDSPDVFILEAIFKGGYRPRVVTGEFNVHYKDKAWTMTPAHAWSKRDCLYGSGAKVYYLMAKKYGYSMVGWVDGLDVFLIRDDILQEHGQVPPEWESFHFEVVNIGFHPKCQDLPNAKLVYDYEVYESTGDMQLAHAAVRGNVTSDSCLGILLTK